ncbi:conserved hypothetical protein [Frankia sp. AgKG'84/4]
MEAIFEADIPVLLDPAKPITRNAVRAVVRRWENAGLVEAEHAVTYQGRLIHVTPAGRRLVIRAELDTMPTVVPPVLGDLHRALVSRARLRIEERGVAEASVDEWVSTRRWRLENAVPVRHEMPEPDGLLYLNDSTISVVLLCHTITEIQRLHSFLSVLAAEYPKVLLVVPQELLTRTRELIFGAWVTVLGNSGDSLHIVII